MSADYESLEAALWDWREAFLGSDDVGDDAFGRLIEKAVAHDLAFDRITSENERLRARLARAVECCERPDGVCLDKADLWGAAGDQS